MVKRTLVAAAASVLIVAMMSTASHAAAPSGPDAAVLQNWRALMAKNPSPEQGCFHVSYPSTEWESVACDTSETSHHPVRRPATPGAPMTAGDTNDYVIGATGLINFVYASFPQVSGVTSEQTVGVAAFDDEGILGANEYSLQLNTNADLPTFACEQIQNCKVWQQFIYATDYNTKGKGALFMEYWLLDWGSNKPCPPNFQTSVSGSETDCWKNSKKITPVLDIPAADLGQVLMTASVTAGGNDVLTLTYGADLFSVAEPDNELGINAVWNKAEFNVVGDGEGSEADFNAGASINVQIMVEDGSTSFPLCLPGSGTTAETNNLNLGTCQAGLITNESIGFTDPYIEFNEYLAKPVTVKPPGTAPPVGGTEP
jgi:hypothetical protein